MHNHRVQEFNKAGEYMAQFGSEGSGAGQFFFNAPDDLAVGPNASLWVADALNNRVEHWSATVEPLSNTSLPTISGEAKVGQTQTVGTGTWSGTPPSYTYQWQTCNSAGEECSNISGATGKTYVLGAPDVGMTVRVKVTALNAEGSVAATSAATSVVAAATPPSNLTAPVVTGSPKNGQTLSATAGTWEGTAPIVYAYQWQNCNSEGEECANIAGATAAKYTLGSGDEEAKVRVLVTATNVGGSAQKASAVSAQIEPGAPSELRGPSIAGIPDAGNSLQGEAGEWEGSEVELTYQWESCNATGEECAAIPGGDEATYTSPESSIGNSLRLRIGASNELGSVTELSPPTAPIGESSTLQGTAGVTVSGTTQVGQTLAASTGSWLGNSIVAYDYQWQMCNLQGQECESIGGATGSTYYLGTETIGHTLRVLIDASEFETVVSEASSTTGPVAALGAPVSEETPVAHGTGLVGSTLMAETGSWSSETPISYAYQWQRCNEYGTACTAITGATASSYTATEGDAESTIRVLVTASNSESSTEAESEPLTISPTTVRSATRASISGTAVAGELLSIQPGIWTASGPVSYAYQWQLCNPAGESCTPITGATEASYKTSSADAGGTLEALVNATTESETATVASFPTPEVTEEEQAPEDLLAPSIEGNATTGETLTASPGVWLGSEPISYAYQWERCNEEGEECAAISGASSSTYALTEADVGSTVTVTVTATNSAGSESAAAYITEVVGAPGPPANTEAPTIEGSSIEGKELTGANGTWSGSRPLKYTHQWERCNSAGESCSTIEGAIKTTYTPITADVGHTLRLQVTATNALASAAVLSGPSQVIASAHEAVASEAIENLQEADPSLLAKSTSHEIESQTVQPATSDAGEQLSSDTTLVGSTISKETPGELAVETPAGNMTLTPTEQSPSASKLPTIVNGTAGVIAESAPNTDTVLRPDALGATVLTQLQSAEAPKSFSWELDLGPNQELQSLPDGGVAVVELPPETDLEVPLGEGFEGLEGAGEETSPGSEEGSEEEEPEGEGEGPSLFEPLPAAPFTTTPAVEARSGEIHPQETLPVYESDSSALSASESDLEGTTIMVIQPPSVMDAAGKTVPAALSFEGETITMALTPDEETTYPVTAEAHVTSRGSKGATPPAVEYGLSDDIAHEFEKSDENKEPVNHFDARLAAGGTKAAPLHVTNGRLVLFWNTLPSNAGLKEWLRAVKKAKLKPLITLAWCKQGRLGIPHCPANGEPDPSTPTKDVETYRAAFRKLFVGLRKLYEKEPLVYPAVNAWGAWNEPDFEGSPLAGRAAHVKGRNKGTEAQGAETAAYLWQAARSVVVHAGCPGCKVVAGEFQDFKANLFYAQTYITTLLHKHRYWHGLPHYWGIHDYGDVGRAYKHEGNPIAKEFLDDVPWGELGDPHQWMTEAGVKQEAPIAKTGCYQKFYAHGKSPTGPCKEQKEAAQDFLQLRNIPARKGARQLERAYYYEYRAPEEGFDSAMLEASGTEPTDWRPAYCVLAFHTQVCPSQAKTKGSVAGGLTTTRSSVQLDVNPYEAATHYWVEYGTTTSYGATSPSTPLPSSEGEQTATVTMSGLSPCTTYHYQAESENEGNEGEPSLGGDKTFKTECEEAAAIKELASGGNHSCELLAEGIVECWGRNDSGQLGNGTTANSKTPVKVKGITTAISVTAGENYSCAGLANGTVECWGGNEEEQLGDGTTKKSTIPVRVISVSDAVVVTAVGFSHACSVTPAGKVECWGADGLGQAPELLEGLGSASSLGGGVDFTCAVLTDGKVECWGGNPGGLGDGTTTFSGSPVEVAGISTGIGATASSSGFACVVLSSGTIECWGTNSEGELGDATTVDSATPVAVDGIANATKISSGEGFACAALANGRVECWGSNEDGQLGNGTTVNSSTPVRVTGVTEATSVSANGKHACALLSGNSVYCWGERLG